MMIAMIISILFIILILVMVLVQIHLAYKFKHEIHPLKEGDEIRVHTDNRKFQRKSKKEKLN